MALCHGCIARPGVGSISRTSATGSRNTAKSIDTLRNLFTASEQAENVRAFTYSLAFLLAERPIGTRIILMGHSFGTTILLKILVDLASVRKEASEISLTRAADAALGRITNVVLAAGAAPKSLYVAARKALAGRSRITWTNYASSSDQALRWVPGRIGARPRNVPEAERDNSIGLRAETIDQSECEPHGLNRRLGHSLGHNLASEWADKDLAELVRGTLAHTR